VPQEGYGAFTVSRSNIAAIRRYVTAKEEHHPKRPFQDFDERFLS